jgi:hypothetical protein
VWFITFITSNACKQQTRNGLGENQRTALTARRTVASSFCTVVDSSGVLYSLQGEKAKSLSGFCGRCQELLPSAHLRKRAESEKALEKCSLCDLE